MGEQLWTVSVTVNVVEGADARLLTHVAFGAPGEQRSGHSLQSHGHPRGSILYIGIETMPAVPLEPLDRLAANALLESQYLAVGELHLLADSMNGEPPSPQRPPGTQELLPDALYMMWPAYRVQLLQPALGAVSLDGIIAWSLYSEQVVNVTSFVIDITLAPEQTTDYQLRAKYP